MRLLIFITTLFIVQPIYGQFFRTELECQLGAYYYNETNYQNNSYSLKKKGVTTSISVRVHLNFGKHWSLIPGVGVDRIYVYYSPINSEVFTSLHLGYKTSFLPNFPYSKLTISSGIEIEPAYGVKIPLTFGVENELSETVNWTFRMKVPTLLDTKVTDLYDFTEIGFETGLKVWLKSNKPIEPLTVYGNPFILE